MGLSAGSGAGAVNGSGSGVTDEAVTAEARALGADLLRQAARREQAAAPQPGDRPRPGLRWWASEDGWVRFRGWLPPEEGAALIAAVERAEDDHPDPETGAYDPLEVRRAGGLVALASTALAADADPDRACVVVHVSVENLVSTKGSGELASGGLVPAAVVRRLSCDARIETVLSTLSGVVGIGRASRQVPGHLGRHLHHRDGTCRFPGCGRRRHLRAHHIEHWADGGPTDVTNMCLLCSAHHALVHEGGWSITGNPEPGRGVSDTLAFVRPDGTPYQPGIRPGLPPPGIQGMDLMTYLRSRQ